MSRKSLRKVARRLATFLFRRRKTTLIYLGLYKGNSFDKIVEQYDRCFAFEANPNLAKLATEKYSRMRHVKVIHAAVSTNDGVTQFNLTTNDGQSSSLGHPSPDWQHVKSGDVRVTESVTVPCVNLYNFCRSQGIDYIDRYVSDVQGMDLAVLHTMQPYLQDCAIDTISCEVAKDEKRNIYHDLPDNSESGFSQLLSKDYRVVAKGWGLLTEGQFLEIPEDWWEFDCVWKLKDPDRPLRKHPRL
jgi:FkbM family methyltransferase